MTEMNLIKPNFVKQIDNLKKLDENKKNLSRLIVDKSEIGLYSWEEMVQISMGIYINNTKLKLNVIGSLYDPRMGPIYSNDVCKTCHQLNCPGHFGLIKFNLTCYNPAFLRNILSILTCVCNYCGEMLISDKDFYRNKFDKIKRREDKISAIEKYSKNMMCSRSYAKTDPNIIRCGRNPVFCIGDVKEKGVISYKIREKKGTKDKFLSMPIQRVEALLKNLSESAISMLGFKNGNRPKNMLLKGILVSPNVTRPYMADGTRIRHDSLTSLYVPIIKYSKDPNDSEKLYSAINQLFFANSDVRFKGIEKGSLLNKIQGKKALLRNATQSKRQDHSARTVSNPAPKLKYGEVRLPEVWKKKLARRVRVTDHNKIWVKKLLTANKITGYIKNDTNLVRKNVDKYTPRNGDIIQRWMMDGDVVASNRQPTLHKFSMMSFDVVLGKELTEGLHLSYTTPWNADFDGDENNTWNPQYVDVEADMRELMHVNKNFISSESTAPIVGLVMNSVTGSYKLTTTYLIVEDDLYDTCVQRYVLDKSRLSTFEQRLKKYGAVPKSGRALYSILFPEDFNYIYKGVIILEGILISGVIKKDHVGPISGSIIHALWKKYGNVTAATFITEATWIVNKWLLETGMTVGMSDVHISSKENKCLIEEEYQKMVLKLRTLGTEKCDNPEEEVRRQNEIRDAVNISSMIGVKLANSLPDSNAIKSMSDQGAGTKGNKGNIGQMMGHVGQQYYRGERLKQTLTNNTRLIPHFDPNDPKPEAGGYVAHSFDEGMTPEETFISQAGGREGLLDTALNTKVTGSMHRKMTKAFENMIISTDGSLRTTNGSLLLESYNSLYDIAKTMRLKNSMKEDFLSFVDVESIVRDVNISKGWLPIKLDKIHKRPPNISYPWPNKLKYVDFPITRFERSRLIGTRAHQIENNAPLLIKTLEMDPVKIATIELDKKLLKMYVLREYPNGTVVKKYAN